MKSDTPENNTVYAQYFVPKVQGKVPAVVVLDIMQGNQLVAAHRGDVAGAERRRVDGRSCSRTTTNAVRSTARVRLVSSDIVRTLDGIRQGVLDCRRAISVARWRAPKSTRIRLGMVGTSLGSFLTALTSRPTNRDQERLPVTRWRRTRRRLLRPPESQAGNRVDRNLLGGKNFVKRIDHPGGPHYLRGSTEGQEPADDCREERRDCAAEGGDGS